MKNHTSIAPRAPVGQLSPCSVLVLLGAAVVVLVGCNAQPEATTVEGKITYNGQPVAGLINFISTGGQPLGGAIKPDGTYSFELPPGEYQVRIDTPPEIPAGYKEGDPLPEDPGQLPERYAHFNSSGLTATVSEEAGRQTINFNLP